MDATKLNLITWLINLQDEAVLRKLMALKEESESKSIAKEALIHRAEESKRDIEACRVFPIEEVMKEDWDKGGCSFITDIFDTRQDPDKMKP